MWVFAQKGFLSIVEHRDDKRFLLVRGRFRGDIQALFAEAKVEETPAADYRFRARLSRTYVATRLRELTEEIDYGSFKDHVTPPERHELYVEVWRLMARAQRMATLPPRVLAKVDRVHGPCWEWTGGRNDRGYGRVHWEGKSRQAHHVIYQVLVGPIPTDLELDHLCRNPGCVNPDHLEPVTHQENLRRGDTISARNAAKTHCPQGHAFTPDNTEIKPDGSRRCRECHRRGARLAHYRGGGQPKRPSIGSKILVALANGPLTRQQLLQATSGKASALNNALGRLRKLRHVHRVSSGLWAVHIRAAR